MTDQTPEPIDGCGDAQVTVTIDPPTGSSLVLPPGPETYDAPGTWWNLLSEPEWSLRYRYAPPSEWVPGQVLLGAVEDAGALALRIAIRGSSLADVTARKLAVRTALLAWPGTVTITAETQSGPVTIAGPWQTFPTLPQWGDVVPDEVGMLIAQTTVSIPVNPTGAP